MNKFWKATEDIQDYITNVRSKDWNWLVKKLHQPTDPSSLAVARIVFGLFMVIDVLEERGFGEADLKWGEPTSCKFPLFDFLEPLPLHWMCILYLIMWLSAWGIMLGWNYKLSCFTFAVPYWYMFLLDKSIWNNHSYLFGLLVLLFMATDGHSLCSIDAWKGKIKDNSHVPMWNYAILRFQFVLLYFYAGLKKTDSDWLNGYSMEHLARHWVFNPFKILMELKDIDLYVVHMAGFIIDLTMGFLIYFGWTRLFSFLILSTFHVMNAQMFNIGVFPYVCMGTLPLFCSFNWPKQFNIIRTDDFHYFNNKNYNKSPNCIYEEDYKNGIVKLKRGHHLTVVMLFIHVVLQLFLPYSHFITEGYNNWTNGLYGYSWDMMVHTWDTSRVTIKVIDKDQNKTMFLDPEAWVQNSRWQRHADMVVQYSKCAKRNLNKIKDMKNIEIYLDVWVSLNKRIPQRMYDPNVDILTAHWSPFEPVKWAMPLLNNLDHWRNKIDDIEKEVYSWLNHSEVIFLADFPDFKLENYIPKDLENVTLTVLEGDLAVRIENEEEVLSKGNSIDIPSSTFHTLHNIGQQAAAYMYIHVNKTKAGLPDDHSDNWRVFSVIENIVLKLENFFNAIGLLGQSILRILDYEPIMSRAKMGGGGSRFYNSFR